MRGGSMKKELLNKTQNLKFKEIVYKIEQFHMSMGKQTLDVKRSTITSRSYQKLEQHGLK